MIKSVRKGDMGNSERAKAPVFVLGSPRSGTTFLYDTILSSGNFAVLEAESDVFSVIAPAFGNLKSRTDRAKMLNVWLKSDHFKRTGLNPGEIREEVLSDCRNPGDFLRIVMERMARKQDVERWADNTPAHLLYMQEIKATIPNALFIHIIRDGRDVSVSMDRIGWQAEYNRFPWDRGHGLLVSAVCWDWLVRKGRKNGRRIGADYLEVRYEDLVQRPRETLKVLGAFIHHDLDYDRIQQTAIGTVKTPHSSFTGRTSKAVKEPDSGNPFNPVGRWKGLKGTEVERMEALLAPLLKQLGYAPDESAKLDFTAWRIHAFYWVYREIKQALKRSPLSRFLICTDRLAPGYLDRQVSRWVTSGNEAGQGSALQTSSPAE